MRTYYGLSLALCVRDIAAGLVPFDSVMGIECGCHVQSGNLEQFEQLLDQYQGTYWRVVPEEAKKIALALWYANLLAFPLQTNEDIGFYGDARKQGHWILCIVSPRWVYVPERTVWCVEVHLSEADTNSYTLYASEELALKAADTTRKNLRHSANVFVYETVVENSYFEETEKEKGGTKQSN